MLALEYMGNKYLKDEFLRHKTAAPQYVPAFLKAWTAYRDTLLEQIEQNQSTLGTPLEPGTLEQMNEGQIGQLYELKKASKLD